MDAMEAGASQEEMEQIFNEMDGVIKKADEAMVAIDMGRMQTDFNRWNDTRYFFCRRIY